MGEYDFYLRHASVRGAAWVGFRLGWRGLAGVEGLSARPHVRWRPWVLDASDPDNVAAGSWGAWRWRLSVALFEGFTGLGAVPPTDGRTAPDMRADLLQFAGLPFIQVLDVDDVVYPVKVVGYEEQNIEPYDSAHPSGGWVAQIELVYVPES
ncbi:MAG TPA: hypothetical protein VEY08_16835 [Chloroflexia bacterium]|nr:hypothetical protein [Chloroflexia bacterium]